MVLNEYCASTDLFPVIHNECSTVNYTHHFCMNHFTATDQFLASNSLYKNAHLDSLSNYAHLITYACVSSAASTIPSTRPRGSRGNIPGRSEFVAPLRYKSILWHNIWVDHGRSPDGVVVNIMRTTRAKYHATTKRSGVRR